MGPAIARRVVQHFQGEKILRAGDRVIQARNSYDLGVFNGDIGRVVEVSAEEMTCGVAFAGGGDRQVVFTRDALSDLSLAYAITIQRAMAVHQVDNKKRQTALADLIESG